MTGGDAILSNGDIDQPAIYQSACITCQNKNTCRAISKAVATLSSEDMHQAATSQQRKKFASIADHLRREGFYYPNVTKATHCWIYHKFGVATFYENQLSSLLEQILMSNHVIVGARRQRATRLAPRS